MKLPRYWTRGTIEETDLHGGLHRFSGWGWSDVSLGDAEALGKERARKIAARILEGDRPDHYLYGDSPVREEVLEEFKNSQGKVYAAITRNSYGCQVLNTADIMFVDVDLPAPVFLESLKSMMGRLFKRAAPSPAEQLQSAALAKLDTLVEANPGWGVRIYRTRAGLRYLFAHATIDPGSDMAVTMMEMLEADPLYLKLCKAQESYRARLTPKPWRCGMAAPSMRWPWPSASAEMRFREWEGAYLLAAQPFATCRFIGQLGKPAGHPTITAMIDIHDRRTKANTESDLA
jgi:hypothetical protein